MEKKTLKEIYDSIENVSPKLAFIKEIADATMKSEGTVRMWIAERQTPDSLTKSILAQKLGVDECDLFPRE